MREGADMSGWWLLPGIGLLAAGLVLWHRGLLLLTPSDGKSMLPSVIRLFTAASPAVLIAAAAALQRQGPFLTALLVGFGGANLLLGTGLSSFSHPQHAERILFAREYPVILIVLIFLVIAGRGTFAAGHPETVLTRKSGIFFLVLAAAELLLLAATVMRGYPPEPASRKASFVPVILCTAIGLCLMMGGAVLTVWGAEGISDRTGIWPAFIGFCIGGPVLALLAAPCMVYLRENGKRYLCMSYFGTGALSLTLGFGIACLLGGLRLTVVTVILAAVILAALLCCGLMLFLRRRVGRGAALCCLIGYAILFFLLYPALSSGFLR